MLLCSALRARLHSTICLHLLVLTHLLFQLMIPPPPQNNFNYFESIADCASDCLDRQDRLISSDIVESAQRNLIINALQKNNYNRKKAAMELGIHKSTLFRKINKLGISLPTGFDGRSSDKL
ncbi:MAG: hypothetical protein HQK68_06180 [Desulfamplus sp.]|nr:hypothetical protein [Desulfamplus sp.]